MFAEGVMIPIFATSTYLFAYTLATIVRDDTNPSVSRFGEQLCSIALLGSSSVAASYGGVALAERPGVSRLWLWMFILDATTMLVHATADSWASELVLCFFVGSSFVWMSAWASMSRETNDGIARCSAWLNMTCSVSACAGLLAGSAASTIPIAALGTMCILFVVLNVRSGTTPGFMNVFRDKWGQEPLRMRWMAPAWANAPLPGELWQMRYEDECLRERSRALEVDALGSENEENVAVVQARFLFHKHTRWSAFAYAFAIGCALIGPSSIVAGWALAVGSIAFAISIIFITLYVTPAALPRWSIRATLALLCVYPLYGFALLLDERLGHAIFILGAAMTVPVLMYVLLANFWFLTLACAVGGRSPTNELARTASMTAMGACTACLMQAARTAAGVPILLSPLTCIAVVLTTFNASDFVPDLAKLVPPVLALATENEHE